MTDRAAEFRSEFVHGTDTFVKYQTDPDYHAIVYRCSLLAATREEAAEERGKVALAGELKAIADGVRAAGATS